MLSILRPYLTWRIVLFGMSGLMVAAFAASWAPPYASLHEALRERYRESEGRAAWQMREREAAAREEAERRTRQEREAAERRAREDAEAARARTEREAAEQRRQEGQEIQRQLRALYDEYRRFVADYEPRTERLRLLLESRGTNLARASTHPEFYTRNNLTVEETSSRRACSDPAGSLDSFNRTARRERNLVACATYLVLNQQAAPPEEFIAILAMFARLTEPGLRDELSLPDTLATVWSTRMVARFTQSAPPPPFSELTSGDEFNPALLSGVIVPGFARQFFGMTTMAERLELQQRVYPDLRRMHEIATRIHQLCEILPSKGGRCAFRL